VVGGAYSQLAGSNTNFTENGYNVGVWIGVRVEVTVNRIAVWLR
jgi:hypothetical protein